GPAVDDVVAPAADDCVITGAAVDREVDLAGLERRGVDGIAAGAPVDDQRVVVRVGAVDRHLRRQSVDDDRRPAADDADLVVAGGAVDGHGVRLAVAHSAAGRRCEVDGDLRHVGSGEVVDGDAVGTAQGVNLDVLDTVEIHGDVAAVAGGSPPLAIGGDVHLLAHVGAVEHEGIDAVLALDYVAAVAGVPDEQVVAGAEKGGVVAATADHSVVAVAAKQKIGALTSDDVVVAGAAVEGEHRIAGRQRRRGEGIVAVATADDERIV